MLYCPLYRSLFTVVLSGARCRCHYDLMVVRSLRCRYCRCKNESKIGLLIDTFVVAATTTEIESRFLETENRPAEIPVVVMKCLHF